MTSLATDLASGRRTDWRVAHSLIRLHTEACLEFIDITERIAARVADAAVHIGIVNVQSQHTTAALLVNENEPLLLDDFRAALERFAPRSIDYRHDDLRARTVNLEPGEPRNGHAHVKALLLRASESLNIIDGRLHIGRWQRIFLVELDRARDRAVSVLVFGRGTASE